MITNISNINGHNIACYLITDEMTKKLRIFMVLVRGVMIIYPHQLCSFLIMQEVAADGFFIWKTH